MSTNDEEGVPGHIVGAARRGSYPAARVICRDWHGGSDHHITGLSHGCEWASFGLSEEAGSLLSTEKTRSDLRRPHAIAELEALIEFADKHSHVHAFDTLHGHTFMDHDGYGDCLSCGAQYELVHTSKTDVHRGRYRNTRGDDPTPCIGWGSQRPHGEEECPVCHGDPMATSGDVECRSCEAAALNPCNCIRCTG